MLLPLERGMARPSPLPSWRMQVALASCILVAVRCGAASLLISPQPNIIASPQLKVVVDFSFLLQWRYLATTPDCPSAYSSHLHEQEEEHLFFLRASSTFLLFGLGGASHLYVCEWTWIFPQVRHTIPFVTPYLNDRNGRSKREILADPPAQSFVTVPARVGADSGFSVLLLSDHQKSWAAFLADDFHFDIAIAQNGNCTPTTAQPTMLHFTTRSESGTPPTATLAADPHKLVTNVVAPGLPRGIYAVCIRIYFADTLATGPEYIPLSRLVGHSNQQLYVGVDLTSAATNIAWAPLWLGGVNGSQPGRLLFDTDVSLDISRDVAAAGWQYIALDGTRDVCHAAGQLLVYAVASLPVHNATHFRLTNIRVPQNSVGAGTSDVVLCGALTSAAGPWALISPHWASFHLCDGVNLPTWRTRGVCSGCMPLHRPCNGAGWCEGLDGGGNSLPQRCRCIPRATGLHCQFFALDLPLLLPSTGVLSGHSMHHIVATSTTADDPAWPLNVTLCDVHSNEGCITCLSKCELAIRATNETQNRTLVAWTHHVNGSRSSGNTSLTYTIRAQTASQTGSQTLSAAHTTSTTATNSAKSVSRSTTVSASDVSPSSTKTLILTVTQTPPHTHSVTSATFSSSRVLETISASKTIFTLTDSTSPSNTPTITTRPPPASASAYPPLHEFPECDRVQQLWLRQRILKLPPSSVQQKILQIDASVEPHVVAVIMMIIEAAFVVITLAVY